RGTLTFAGPIDNPALNIRAVRPNIDVTAGVLVTGTARDPKIELFSAPTMSDVDMLSYIVTGRPFAGATAADGSLLARAALGLGIARSGILTSKLRNAFGLDQLALDAGSTVDDTTLVAGKQLTSQLSARSEFNVFDQIWSVFLRYRLSEMWSIE